MKQRTSAPEAPLLGGTSLLVIFCILCLTVFAMLTISAAQAEKRLSDSFAKSVSDYYQADVQAGIVFAQLRNGIRPDFVQENGGVFSYQIPISQHQTLQVQLQKDDTGWTVLQWQPMVHTDSTGPFTLPLWDGNTLQEVSP